MAENAAVFLTSDPQTENTTTTHAKRVCVEEHIFLFKKFSARYCKRAECVSRMSTRIK